MPYVGRFAPSPTGPLHAGSVVAALGSWLDAKSHGGQWLVRVEDLDLPRCPPGIDTVVLRQLDALGLRPDAPPVWQSQRSALYEAALQRLITQGDAFPCACTRAELAASQGERQRHGERVYPGTCRPERGGLRGRPARAWRFRVREGLVHWHDAALGPQQQNVAQAVGDFVLRRADGLWAYQLAVVVDDAAQGVTHVVRGADLTDNTARQIQLQRALGLPTPQYRHLPLVLAADGHKLSKQNGAEAIDETQPLQTLQAAASLLGLQVGPQRTLGDWLSQAIAAWRLAAARAAQQAQQAQ